MVDQGVYRILGSLGSPYSMKIRAIMRYRRLPHIWIQTQDAHNAERAMVKVPVIPVVQYLDGSYHNDSTPMIHDLEKLHPRQRSIIPDDPADAFLAALLEDMADEWGTKFMFHYRWFRERDQKQMSEWLAFDRFAGGGCEQVMSYANSFRDRQVQRMAIVGCTPANQPMIETTCARLLNILETHLIEQAYFFGSRPSLAEFSWFGQLSQLIVDPTPNDLLRATAPFTTRWIMQMDDASGVEGEWRGDGRMPGAVRELLRLAGDVYFPFLLANAAALARGAHTFTFTAQNMTYEQGVFKYQARCLEALRGAYHALGSDARARIEPLLRETGCFQPLTAAAATTPLMAPP
jgi:glutathione S-transferase